MTTIIFCYLGILVEYIDGAITCTADGVPQGEYTMGSTMIVGSTILSAAIRRAIHAEIEATLAGMEIAV
jgi:hypothetical protein